MANKVEVVVSAKDQASGVFNKFNKSMVRLSKTVLKVGAGMTVLGGGIFALAKSTANAGDKFQKMAQRVGVSASVLSEFAHVAELSGSSIETVENGFRLLSKRMLDTQEGLAEAKRSFDRLGISVEKSDGSLRAVDVVFEEAAQAINALGSETEKTALAQEIFGRSGTQLLPLIRAGGEGIKAMREEARRLGITFTELEAQQAAEFQDALTRLKGSLTGVKNTLAKDLLPAITEAANAWARWLPDVLPKVKKFFTEVQVALLALPDIMRQVGGFIGDTFRKVLNDPQILATFFDNFKNFSIQVGRSFASLLSSIGQLIAKASAAIFAPLFEGFIFIGKKIQAGAKLLWAKIKSIFKSGTDDTSKTFDELKEAWENVTFDTKTLEATMAVLADDTLIAADKVRKEATKMFEEAVNKIGNFTIRSFEDYKKFTEKIRAELNKTSEANAKAASKTTDSINDSVNDSKKVFEDWFDSWRTITESFQNISQATFQDMRDKFSDAMSDLIVTGKSMEDQFENIFESIKKSMIKLLITEGITQVAQALVGLVKGFGKAKGGKTAGAEGISAAGIGGGVLSGAGLGATVGGVPGAIIGGIGGGAFGLFGKQAAPIASPQLATAGGVTVQTLNLFPGATITESVINMPKQQLATFATRILDELNFQGDRGATTTLRQKRNR